MDILYEIGSVLASILPLSFWDFLDIGVLWYIIFRVAKYMRETRAVGLAKGLIILALAYLIVNMLKMKAIMYILNNAMDVGLFALIVLFQPELRRFLEKIGQSKVSKVYKPETASVTAITSKWKIAIEAICDACDDLSASTTGALIVIERETKITEQIDMGPLINAVPSKQLFETIFFLKTPLHDGAVVMRDGMIYAAACFLPMPQSGEGIDNKLHSRHRAAIGMSENSDAIIIVVSEETGTISVAENGNIHRSFSKDELKKYLRDGILGDKPSSRKASKPIDDVRSLFRRKK